MGSSSRVKCTLLRECFASGTGTAAGTAGAAAQAALRRVAASAFRIAVGNSAAVARDLSARLRASPAEALAVAFALPAAPAAAETAVVVPARERFAVAAGPVAVQTGAAVSEER